MLVVHPSSTCDVCLDRFSDNSNRTPHSIPCGHVFCHKYVLIWISRVNTIVHFSNNYSCLLNVNPRICPLCRRNFQIERARKLHIDLTDAPPSPGPPQPTQEEIEVRELEQRVAEACMDGVSDDECQSIIGSVMRWLETRPLEVVSY